MASPCRIVPSRTARTSRLPSRVPLSVKLAWPLAFSSLDRRYCQLPPEQIGAADNADLSAGVCAAVTEPDVTCATSLRAHGLRATPVSRQ
jgi:hypothetical protein